MQCAAQDGAAGVPPGLPGRLAPLPQTESSHPPATCCAALQVQFMFKCLAGLKDPSFRGCIQVRTCDASALAAYCGPHLEASCLLCPAKACPTRCDNLVSNPACIHVACAPSPATVRLHGPGQNLPVHLLHVDAADQRCGGRRQVLIAAAVYK